MPSLYPPCSAGVYDLTKSLNGLFPPSYMSYFILYRSHLNPIRRTCIRFICSSDHVSIDTDRTKLYEQG